MAACRARERGRRDPGLVEAPGEGEARLSQAELERGVGQVLVAEEALQARVRELGREITADYAGRELLLIGVLKGAVFFMSNT